MPWPLYKEDQQDFTKMLGCNLNHGAVDGEYAYLTPRDDCSLGAVLWLTLTAVSARRRRSQRPINPVFLRVMSSLP